MPDPSRTQASNENVALTLRQIASEARSARAQSRAARAIQAEERERRDIRARELATSINELEDIARELVHQREELFEQEPLAGDKLQADYESYRKELAYNPEPVITANLRESDLGIAYNQEMDKIRTHIINGTTTSDDFRRAKIRSDRLRNRLLWKREQAEAEFDRMKQRARVQYEESSADYQRINTALTVVNDRLNELDASLALMLREANALNGVGQGKRRKHNTRKKGKRRGKN